MGMREEFEAWYEKRYGKRDMTDTWEHARFCDALEVWQASRAALVIDLGEARETATTEHDCELTVLAMCVDAIEAVGVSYK